MKKGLLLGSQRSRPCWLSLCATLAIVMASDLANARADTIYWNVDPLGEIPRFDPTNGRLTSVSIVYAGNWQSKNGVYNPTQFGTPYTLSFVMPIGAGVAGSGLWASGSLAYSSDGFAPAMSFTEGLWKMDTFAISDDTSLPADLDYFTGIDPIWFSTFQGGGGPSVSPGYLQPVPMTFGWAGVASGSYTYEPVPEPGVLTLLIGSFAALWLRSRRLKLQAPSI